MTLRRVGIVAGEASGDILGAGLMSELKNRYPEVEFIGVGGVRMAALGLDQLYPMEPLSVMGLIEPLKRLPELLGMRRNLAKGFIGADIDLFVGIDSPDFNLGLAKRLKNAGIKTLHYVSPSVWAWRQGRIKSIAKSIDLMLTLLPFEAAFYKKHNVPVRFVGHPLASEISGNILKADSRSSLQLDPSRPCIALLPGSRSGEIKHLVPTYLQTLNLIGKTHTDIQFVFAAVNQAKADQIKTLIGDIDIQIVVDRAIEVVAAADVVLAASGTTTLEIMLVNRPLIVAYRSDWLTFKIISSMLKVPYVSLPNLIAGKEVVSEYLQTDATAEKLTSALLALLEDEPARLEQEQAFDALAQQLRLPSNKLAAEAATTLVNDCE
jgi:lipid-A-disaccharide synthase